MGVGPLSSVFLNSHAMARATTMPSRYIASMVNPCRPNTPAKRFGGMHAAMSSVYTGSRAEQLINGATRMVTSRSLGVSMVRAAMIPGMAQANELSIGMKLFPCSPTLLMRRSIRKAARAMYPVSSSRPMKKKRRQICGRKTTTAPTPAMTPSTSRLCNAPSLSIPPTTPPNHSTPVSSMVIGHFAMVKMLWNISAMIPMKISVPQILCVTTRSMRSLKFSVVVAVSVVTDSWIRAMRA